MKRTNIYTCPNGGFRIPHNKHLGNKNEWLIIKRRVIDMKKFFILAVIATMCVSCGSRELNEVCNMYEEVSSAKDEKKKDPNFLIFKDRTQTGKEESR